MAKTKGGVPLSVHVRIAPSVGGGYTPIWKPAQTEASKSNIPWVAALAATVRVETPASPDHTDRLTALGITLPLSQFHSSPVRLVWISSE